MDCNHQSGKNWLIILMPVWSPVDNWILIDGHSFFLLLLSSDIIFTHLFQSIFDPTSLPSFTDTHFFSYVYLSYASSHSWQDNKDTIWLVMVHWSTYSQHWLLDCHTIYLAMESPKQPISNLTTRSCAGTPSVALSIFYWSKFRTSWTWNERRSASTARRPQLVARFLQSTTVRSPWPWASCQGHSAT